MTPAPDNVEISVLGPLTAHRGAVDVTPTAQRERTILALLALDDGSSVSLHRLLETMWGDEPPAAARNSIQVAVSRLRGRLDLPDGESNLINTPSGYLLRDATVDAHTFGAEYRSIMARHRDQDADTDVLVGAIRAALGRWRDRTVLVDLQWSVDVLVHARQLERKRLELLELLGSTLVELDPRGAVDAVEHDAHLEWSRPMLQDVYLRGLMASGLRRDARLWCTRLEDEHQAENSRIDTQLAELIGQIRQDDVPLGRA